MLTAYSGEVLVWFFFCSVGSIFAGGVDGGDGDSGGVAVVLCHHNDGSVSNVNKCGGGVMVVLLVGMPKRMIVSKQR